MCVAGYAVSVLGISYCLSSKLSYVYNRQTRVLVYMCAAAVCSVDTDFIRIIIVIWLKLSHTAGQEWRERRRNWYISLCFLNNKWNAMYTRTGVIACEWLLKGYIVTCDRQWLKGTFVSMNRVSSFKLHVILQQYIMKYILRYVIYKFVSMNRCLHLNYM